MMGLRSFSAIDVYIVKEPSALAAASSLVERSGAVLVSKAGSKLCACVQKGIANRLKTAHFLARCLKDCACFIHVSSPMKKGKEPEVSFPVKGVCINLCG